ncbi:FxLYD domain-containing protein [Streptomyces sp. NPDC014891]|uniref:FxLYD domain-containing protein n=1 Tax=Streptomyces sp. NPDC014891 TaxID=3364929 RepID=UPI0036FBDD63
MNPTSERGRRPVRARAVSAAAAVVVTALGAVGLVSCGSDDDTGGTAVSERPTAPDTAGFTGELPSSVASSGQAAIESARASASSAAASASAREAERKASIGAEAERSRQEAEEELKDVRAPGNAGDEVAMTGKPRAETGGVLTVVLNITNTTDEEASYAVQVDFLDPSGKVVETQFVGEEDLEPGERRQPLVISRQPADPVLTPKLVKAQRY